MKDTAAYDLVIVGASFAGLVCARAAAIRGLRTLVLEAKREPGARISTTGILVKEAAEEVDLPPGLTRTVHGVRLYSPSLNSVDLFAPGYYFLTSDTADLLRWLAREAETTGAHVRCSVKLSRAVRQGDMIFLPQLGIRTRYLVGADGARSTVARLFDLGRNSRFLTGLEVEYPELPGADPGYLHCFLDSRLARGYLGWVAPAPGFFQVGLAAVEGARPDLRAFLGHAERLFGFSKVQAKERRSGRIPCGGPVHPFAAPRVLLIGDAAGHVSPLTGGGIRLAFRYGRRAAQLIADHLTRHGPPPELVLAAEIPAMRRKLLLRRIMDGGPPNWLYDLAIGTPVMNWFARKVYFHRRAQPGDSLEAFEQRVKSRI
ncbi:MAG: NAD(P)/FAD-dependent oxidoreductase [Parvibaculaceae bacterium]